MGIFFARVARCHAHIVAIALADLVGHHFTFFGNLVVGAPDKALDGVERVFCVNGGLAFGRLAHQALATLGERHNRWCGAVPLGAGDDDSIATFHHRHTRIGCSQVNTNNLAHKITTPLRCISQ